MIILVLTLRSLLLIIYFYNRIMSCLHLIIWKPSMFIIWIISLFIPYSNQHFSCYHSIFHILELKIWWGRIITIVFDEGWWAVSGWSIQLTYHWLVILNILRNFYFPPLLGAEYLMASWIQLYRCIWFWSIYFGGCLLRPCHVIICLILPCIGLYQPSLHQFFFFQLWLFWYVFFKEKFSHFRVFKILPPIFIF